MICKTRMEMDSFMFHEALSLAGFVANRKPADADPVLSMDEETFSTFYRATAPALKGYIRKMCGNSSLTEDIFQESFYRLLRANLPKMDASQMKSYLFKIATSLLIDHWRREKRERFWKDLWHAPAATQHGDGGDISSALSTLKPSEQALLWLAYVEGFNHAEIASTLGLNEKSIRVMLFRARKRLVHVLERRGSLSGAKP